MSDRLLNLPFETSGEWYLLENPSNKIAGSLNYSPERTELHLLESFKPLRGPIRFGETDQAYPVVHGITREGEAMTLLNAQRARWYIKFGTGGLRQPELLVSSLLVIGAHLPPDFSYPEMSFRVPGLQIWLSRQIIEQTIEQDEIVGTTTNSYNIRGMTKEKNWIPSINANLEWAYSWQSNCDGFTSIAVAVSAWLTIRPNDPQTAEWYFKQLGKISTMLAFLAGSPMSPDCIKASIGEEYQDVYIMVALHNAKYCSYTNLDDFFMSKGEMGVDLTDVVVRWFELYPKLHMPSQLALSVLASEKLWLHVEFLSLMQALEGFHRALFVGYYMSEDEYESVKKALGDAIPTELSSDHKDALRSRIRYGNQISLRKRLDELAGSLPEQIRKVILGFDRTTPRSWIDTRNYYTHWDEELRSNMLDSQGMFNAHVRLRHFLRVLYLNLMGIPQEAILKSLQNASNSSQHLAQLNLKERPDDKENMSGVVMVVQEKITGDGDHQENETGSPKE